MPKCKTNASEVSSTDMALAELRRAHISLKKEFYVLKEHAKKLRTTVDKLSADVDRKDVMINSLSEEIARRDGCKLVTTVASANHILSLPIAAIASIFTEFLPIIDVCRFDSATTNHEDRLRSAYLQIMCDTELVFQERIIKQCIVYVSRSGKILSWMHLRKMRISILCVSCDVKKNRITELPMVEELELISPTATFIKHLVDSASFNTLRKLTIKNTPLKHTELKKILQIVALVELDIHAEKNNFFYIPWSRNRFRCSLKKLSVAGVRFCIPRTLSHSATLCFSTMFFHVRELQLDHCYGGDAALRSFIFIRFCNLKILTITGYSNLSLACLLQFEQSGIRVRQRLRRSPTDGGGPLRAEAEAVFDALPASTWYSEEAAFLASMADLFPNLNDEHLATFFAPSRVLLGYVIPYERGLLCLSLLTHLQADQYPSEEQLAECRTDVISPYSFRIDFREEERRQSDVQDHVDGIFDDPTLSGTSDNGYDTPDTDI